jgi:hypothetical protein
MYDPYDKNVLHLGDAVKSKQEIAADGPGWSHNAVDLS